MSRRVKYIKLPWQKAFRSVPEQIVEKLKTIMGDVQVVCVQDIKRSHIESGRFSHLKVEDIDLEDDCKTLVMPPIEVGRTSRTNVEGIERKLKHLGKVHKTFCVDVPNFGDASKGYHEMCQDRLVWPKEFEGPREYTIGIEKIGYDAANDCFTLKFSVESVINANTHDFEKELLFCLNLLQENTGLSDVYSSEMSRDEFMQINLVTWEFLPPGTKDEVLKKIEEKFKNLTEASIEMIKDRYEFMSGLEPQEYIYGTTGMGRYFGAKFRDDIVVFENIRYGNAMYIMYGNWQDLSKLSRLELLAQSEREFDRVIHKNGWKSRVKRLIQKKLES